MVRVLTWNLQGSHGVDIDAAAAVIRSAEPDVVALQEVQRRHAAALAAALSMTRRWAFKHWPVVDPAEGLAILSRAELRRTATFSLRRAPFWDWRRRIGLGATVAIEGRDVGIADVHLSPHREVERRRREAARTLARTAHGPRPIIVGDLNDCPGAGAHTAFLAAGWIDAWSAVHGEEAGPTNWTAGDRIGRPPTQRIDYVLAPPGSTVDACAVLADAARYDDIAAISDHLPLAATIRLGGEVA